MTTQQIADAAERIRTERTFVADRASRHLRRHRRRRAAGQQLVRQDDGAAALARRPQQRRLPRLRRAPSVVRDGADARRAAADQRRPADRDDAADAARPRGDAQHRPLGHLAAALHEVEQAARPATCSSARATRPSTSTSWSRAGSISPRSNAQRQPGRDLRRDRVLLARAEAHAERACAARTASSSASTRAPCASSTSRTRASASRSSALIAGRLSADIARLRAQLVENPMS